MLNKGKTDMAVAALSTSAIALTATPASAAAPAPQTADAPQAFAKLVARAKPDEKAQQDGAGPETSADAETETAGAPEEVTSAAVEGAPKDVPAAHPTDLLAEIEALVTAAGQFLVGQPAPAATTPVAPVLVTTPQAGPIATITTARPPSPVAAPTAAPPITSVTATPVIPPTTAIGTTGPVSEAAATTSLDTAASPQPSQPGKTENRNFAALLSSLKNVFQSADTQVAAPAAGAPSSETAANHGDAAIAQAPKAVIMPVTDTPEEAPSPAPVQAITAALPTAEAPASAPTAAPPVAEATASVDSVLLGEAAGAKLQADTAKVQVDAAKVETDTANGADRPAQQPDLPMTARSVDPAPKITHQMAVATESNAMPAGNDAEAPKEAAAPPVAASAPAPAVTLPTTAVPAAALSPAPAATAGDIATAAPDHAEQSVARQLDLVRDHRWLDQIARDISQAATQQGHLRFQLNPEHLGALTVEIANSASGTSIRMTAETDQARAIIADAQPRLLAEVRAQGLRVAESHVDLNQQGSGGSASAQGQQQQPQQQQRPASEDSKPFTRTQNMIRDDLDDSTTRDDRELYA